MNAIVDKALKQRLIDLYKQYGFEFAKYYEQNQVLVFTIKTGYFNNADLVPLNINSCTKAAFDDFTNAGFACTTRQVQDAPQTEELLFKGFFSVDSILARLDADYKKFTSAIVQVYSNEAKYKYINAPYQINGKEGLATPADEVVSRLNSPKPTLFLIEAAAGFGKTCTAFELVHKITERNEHLPLFSELARNRQAVIFRYILLDEIDRTFPVLSSRLVQHEMKNGRVVTILDGFDELLRKSDIGNDFDNQEPMLETIGEFLTGNAKIVLTTRRTILFEGDAFHTWVDKHSDTFDLIRIRISEPRVSDWLPPQRISALRASGIQIEDIANPVLLSYLRCISDEEFVDVTSDTQGLVEKYFDFMLDREKIRQDLRLDASKQQVVLRSIAEDMMDFGYTSESREYIVDHIENANQQIIDEAISSYPSADRPTREGFINKLASHALLDRSGRDNNKIGFVNEFVFGNFIAQAISKKGEWLSDDMRFIEPAVISYQPRSDESRKRIWKQLLPSAEFLTMTQRLGIAIKLLGKIPFDLINEEASEIEFTNIEIGGTKLENFQFNECTFKDCSFDFSQMSNVTFLNCKYYGNKLINTSSAGQIYELGGIGDSEFINSIISSNTSDALDIELDRQILIERFVLEKFWPIGRETIIHKHRPIKGICTNSAEFKQHEIYNAIVSLKRKSILLEPDSPAFVEINFEEILAIRDILGKGVSNGK